MNFICTRCGSTFKVEIDGGLICKNCEIQLVLLHKQLKINDERIKKLENHKKSELKNTKSNSSKIRLETLERLEYNLQLEYRKRNGIINTINSKNSF